MFWSHRDRRGRRRPAVAPGRRGPARALVHARAGWTRSGSCSAAAAGRRTPGSSSASPWSSPRCSSSASTAARSRRPGWRSWRAASASSGLLFVVGPWVFRLSSDLSAERAERIRTQERADVAAHLHDSVLQTLALIQKSSGDPATVARLARAQERDLRSWLYAGEATDDRSVASALRGAAAEVEDTHGVSVDVVAVGDCADARDPAPGRRRGPRGDDQRRQARRHRPRRRLRRGRRPRRVGVRPRPRRRLRPGRRAGGPDGRPQQHRRPDGPTRRHRRGALRAR